jgi:hypothetical protein
MLTTAVNIDLQGSNPVVMLLAIAVIYMIPTLLAYLIQRYSIQTKDVANRINNLRQMRKLGLASSEYYYQSNKSIVQYVARLRRGSTRYTPRSNSGEAETGSRMRVCFASIARLRISFCR